MRKYTIIIILIILAVIVATQVNAIKNIGKEPKIYSEKTKAKASSITETVSGSGEVKSNTVISLKFQTSGLLTYVGVKTGDLVTKGQLIASLDRRELEKSLIKKLRDYQAERWDFEEDKTVTYKDVALSNTIQRALEQNQFALDKTVIDVEVADIALKFANLYSPIDGIVTSVDAPKAGVNITAATGTFTISDYNDIIFDIEVDEVDIGKIKVGQIVDIRLDAYENQTFMGVVSKIGFNAVTTSSGGTAFPVEVKFPDNMDMRFRNGMNGDAEIQISKVKNTLILLTQYIFEDDNDKKYVYVLTEKNKSVKRKIKTGIETENSTEILSGIKAGETVIIPITN